MKLAFALAGLLVLAGCSKKKSEENPAASTTPAPAPAESAPAERASATPLPEAEPPELPTESDFEQEVTEKITGSNLERELDQLEKELIGR